MGVMPNKKKGPKPPLTLELSESCPSLITCMYVMQSTRGSSAERCYREGKHLCELWQSHQGLEPTQVDSVE